MAHSTTLIMPVICYQTTLPQVVQENNGCDGGGQTNRCLAVNFRMKYVDIQHVAGPDNATAAVFNDIVFNDCLKVTITMIKNKMPGEFIF